MQSSPRQSAPVASLRLPSCAGLSRFVCLLVFVLGAVPRVAALGILVPAYFSPAAGGYWSALNQAAGWVPLVAIMNPNNGPSDAVDSNYTIAVGALRQAGGRVIGYVYSSYTARPLSEVKADIDRYHAFYSIDGFFVDEMTNDADVSHLAYYADLYQYIKAKQASYWVVGNPGINTSASYLTRPTADALVTFESNTGYPQYAPDSWTQTVPATAFAHLCYDVTASNTMADDVRLAFTRNAGYIFVTDDRGSNPWDTLPSFWPAEVDLVESINRQAASNQPAVLRISLETNGTAQVVVVGTPGRYVFEASSNLTNWAPIATNVSPSGRFTFPDAPAANYPSRLYRIAQ
jgi:Spherulation-specific family 4